MRVTMIGTGYVGLVAGTGFAEFGNHVTCVDLDESRITALRSGQVPIYEPGLRDLIVRNAELGRLHFTTDTQSAVARAELVFLAVGTPSLDDGSADVGALFSAAAEVARALRGPCVVAVKSTVPVGTGDALAAFMSEQCSFPVQVVSNPEFMKEGDALSDFMKPTRIILGMADGGPRGTMATLYAPFVRTNDRILYTDRRSAELTKYAANAMLATRISFMNEVSHLASAVNADIESVRLGLGADPRIGNKFLFAGAGFGGSCLPKDIRALLKTANDNQVPLGIIREVERANQRQKRVLLDMVHRHFGPQLAGLRVAVWGLAFKPRTDDVREAPALDLIEGLCSAGASVCAYDPEATLTARRALAREIDYATEMYAAAEAADALVLVTEWACFRNPDFARLRAIMRHPVLFDGRNVWDPHQLRSLGFRYRGIGRRRMPVAKV